VVEEIVEIGCEVQVCWDLVADPRNDPAWCPKVQAVAPAGPGRWTVTHKPVPLRSAMELEAQSSRS
jgi:hypothetical protein